MNFKYSRLASAIMLTVGVTACGGGSGGGNGDDPVISDYNVKLAVQDETGAPVPNITVCLDDNRDESCSVTDDLELTVNRQQWLCKSDSYQRSDYSGQQPDGCC